MNLRNGNFRSQYDPFTLMQRIKKGIEAEYNTVIVPVDKKCMGSEIYYTLQAFVYALFKHKGFIINNSKEDDLATMDAKDILNESEELEYEGLSE